MPKLGESITEGTIVSWSVKTGDRVKEDDVLFEVTTAKVSAEIPSPVAGKVVEIYYKEGDTVAVGTTVALIELSDDEDEDTDADNDRAGSGSETAAPENPQPETAGKKEPAAAEKPAATAASAPATQETPPTQEAPAASESGPAQPVDATNAAGKASGEPEQSPARWYSPVVLQLAREAGLSQAALDRIPGTGFEGRLSKKDIQEYIRQQKASPENKPGISAGQPATGSSGSGAAAPNAAGAGSSAPAGTPSTGGPSSKPAGAVSQGAGESQATAGKVAATPSAGQAPASAATAPAENARKTPDSGNAASSSSPASAGAQAAAGDEVREMDRIRRIIADHMVMSKKTSPHVTTFVEADVTRLVGWRTRRKDEFKKQEGVALTYMPAIAEAAANALKEFPQVNASVDGYRMILKKQINIGIAVSLPDGNLIVPVVHGADKKNLAGLAVEIDALAAKARANKLTPDDLQGGTFTITNFGTFRNLFATPIINQPEAAILGVGYIEKKPAVVETPEGDTIAVRHKMFLSLSYDHRIIDGSLGGAFLRRIADYLENWNR